MYDIYSEFDIDKHKQKYINYLEVVIHPDGKVEYAIPSHQEKLIDICCNKLNISREELSDMCPPEYFFDFVTWLCNTSECISVWTNYIITPNDKPITDKQMQILKKMKDIGIYAGELPK